MADNSIQAVREFWNEHPLWVGESDFPAGSAAFFEEQRRIVLKDCFAGELDERIFPQAPNRRRVLDLGCGIGFWCVELKRRGAGEVIGADLAPKAVELAEIRCRTMGVAANFAVENAEQLSFPDHSFSHVNCQGVIHHTPDTKRAISEIARILEPGGTASLSVYYRNWLLRAWPFLSPLGKFLKKWGGGLKGRGRESIFAQTNPEEIVRLYDGAQNPVGKAYSRRAFLELVEPYFTVEEVYYHFFPARALPFNISPQLHRFLDKKLGFMIYLNLRKTELKGTASFS